MGTAREKLNIAHFNGCLLVAAAVGWLAQSGAVCLAALAVAICGGLYGGDIRVSRRAR